ncbi:MAG: anchored repeat ABC transporter, substrate-binding protein, partial [Angustibacter sp.]
TKPGEYQMSLESSVKSQGTTTPVAKSTVTFAVGVDPKPIAQRRSAQILDQGHTDIAVDLTTRKIIAKTDLQDIPAEDVVIDVPDRALETIPKDPRFSFVGPPDSRIWQLPQAVLGKHVHGEIDPHLWHDARNAKAYVQAISATLSSVDPAGKSAYQKSATAYSRILDDLHRSVGATLATIPPAQRQLITTHDAFGYLAKAYNLTIAGFVVPNPAQEPSAAQVRELSNTVRRLKVPAVFVEPNLHQRAAVLSRVAADAGVSVCEIHGDTFSPKAKNYVDLMNWNARELHRCLTKEPQ